MIGAPIRLLMRVLALLPRLLMFAWRRMRLGRRTVVDVVIGGGSAEDLSQRLERERAIRRLAKDARVRAVRLTVRSVPMGWAAVQGLRAALAEVRAAGKPIVARIDTADDRTLFLVGVSDAVWMPPGGDVMVTGLAAAVPFYGPALQRLGVEIAVESAGAYKSLGEPYTRGFPTTANREALNAVFEDLDTQVAETIAADRDLDLADVRAAQVEGPLSAEQAQDRGLIDRVGYADQMKEALEEALGGEPRVIGLRQYARLTRWADGLARMGVRRPLVAIVHLQGPVMQRRGRVGRPRRMIASEEVVPALDALRLSRRVNAVVLVVDSPGGSSLASDLIARAVVRLNDEKPVVVAMESVAASGGYYIAAPATEIVARPGTVTGSIGVVGGKVVLGPGLAKWGVHAEQIGPGTDASMYGPWSGFTPEQRSRYRASLARVYDRFISIVADGRHREKAQIDAVAQGRVWTGIQALERGLVDHLGGVQDAVSRATSLAKMGDQPIRQIEIRFEGSRWGALNSLMGGASADPVDGMAMALATLGAAGWLPRQLRAHPGEPLAVVPVVIDEPAWSNWT
jgi:protease-4